MFFTDDGVVTVQQYSWVNRGVTHGLSLRQHQVVPYSGTITVAYNRRAFYRTFTNPVHIKDFGNLTVAKILDIINTTLDAGLTLDELEPFTVPTEIVRGETQLLEGKYPIQIKPSSIAHYGDVWITLEKDYVP